MKFLKWLIIVLLAIALLFVLMGFIKPEIKYGHSITVDKPIEEAWKVHQDASKYSQWLEGFQSIDLVSGTPGAVGSTYKVVVNPGDGQEDFIMIETIESIKPNDHIQLSFDSDMMAFNQTTKFEKLVDKTKITTASTVRGKGLFMRSMFAVMDMMGDAFEKQEVSNIEALKKVIHGNTDNYFETPPVQEELIE